MSWEDLKEKLTPALLICLSFYILAGAVTAFMYLPARAQVAHLQDALGQARMTEMALSHTIAQLPSLEVQKAGLERALESFGEQIPSQYDLPRVLEYLESTAQHLGLGVERLEHQPVERSSEKPHPWVTVHMLLTGQAELLGYVDEVQRSLPSFHIRSLGLARANRDELVMEVEGKLYLTNTGQAHAWQRPAPAVDSTAKWHPAFSGDVLGWSGAVIARIANGGLRLMGVIETEGQWSALVSADGRRHWVREGDFVGDVQVVQVEPKSVTLSLGTTRLTLKMGE